MRYTVRVVAVISGSDMLCHVLKGGRKWKQTNWQQNPLSFLATCVNTFLNRTMKSGTTVWVVTVSRRALGAWVSKQGRQAERC